MKHFKSALIMLLVVSMTLALLAGCGTTAPEEQQPISSAAAESVIPEVPVVPEETEPVDAADQEQELVPADDSAPQADAAMGLDDIQKNSIAMLNYITVLSKEISASKGSRLFLEQAYNSLLNNIYPNAVDYNTQDEIVDILDTLESFRMISEKRDRLNFIYEHNKAQALRNAIPNPVGILGAVSSKGILKAAISLLYVAVDSKTSYSSYMEENNLKYLQDGWDLDEEEAEDLHEMRRDAFSYMINMVREYGLPGDMALTEKAVDDFVKWKDMTNAAGRIELLESNQKTYEAFGSYWLLLSKSYFENAEYGKCLEAMNRYEQTNTRIFRSDYEYAETLSYAILAAKELYQGAEYEMAADRYASAIMENTDADDWSSHYYVALTYLDLYELSGNINYLERAYDIALDNVTHLVDDQKELNNAWIDDVQTVPVDKNATKEEKKSIKQYNDQLKEERKKALPPVSSPLRLNCELLFALAEKLEITSEEQSKIDAILHENGSSLFLTAPLDNMFSYRENAFEPTAKLEKGKLILPAVLVSADSVIRLILPDGNVIEDWAVSSVKRPNPEDAASFEATFTSKEWNKAGVDDGQAIQVEIYSAAEAESPDYTLRFTAKHVGVFAAWNPIKKTEYELVS